MNKNNSPGKSNSSSNSNRNRSSNNNNNTMVVVLIVLVEAIVLKRVLVKRMKVVIAMFAVFILILVRTAIICSDKLNIGTNHKNRNSCSSITTIATINTKFAILEDIVVLTIGQSDLHSY